MKSSFAKGAALIACVVLVPALLAGCSSSGGTASAPAPATSAPAEETITVEYTILVIPAEDYPDVEAGQQVTVSDGSGTLLGIGDLSGSNGVYEATFEAKKSSDGFYVVEMGRRGELSYQESDVVDGVLTVSASLGM